MIESTDEDYPNILESGNNIADAAVQGETKPQDEDEGEPYNTMALLELATCVETPQEAIEFPSTDAVLYPKSGQMVCLLCLEDVETNLLSDHMINAHNYRTVLMKCSVCGMKFGERSLLMIHKKGCKPPEKRHKRKSFQQIMKELDGKNYDNDFTMTECPMCSEDVPRYSLKEHMIAEHLAPELSLTCQTCNRTFKSKLSLREHIKLVHKSTEETEECEVCGQKFRSQKYLNNHRRNVHPSGNRVHTCAVCGKSFKSRLCLHQHIKHVHPPPSAAADCPRCQKPFKTRAGLLQHLRVAHGEYGTLPIP